jgi:nucleotide-binding family protein
MTNNKQNPELKAAGSKNKIRHIVGVMSGKGGVGKSTMTSLIANKLNAQGYRVGILDADITGPSIPRLMHIDNQMAYSDGDNIIPVTADNGIKVISLNLIMDEESKPVIWRGPMIGSVVQQFYENVLWGDLDYLLIDMPPGTGDVALTVMQSIPIKGIIMVSMPQNLVSMIVSKAVNMAKQLNVPVIGIIENMSYIECPNCSEKIRMHNDEGWDQFIKDHSLDMLAELPMSPEIIRLSNEGMDEVSLELDKILSGIVDKVSSFCKRRIIL